MTTELRTRVYDLRTGKREVFFEVAEDVGNKGGTVGKYDTLVKDAAKETETSLEKFDRPVWSSEPLSVPLYGEAESVEVLKKVRKVFGMPAVWTRAAVLADMKRVQKEMAA